MKRLKKKIKQFLALWLKDELSYYSKYKDNYPIRYHSEDAIIEKLQSSVIIQGHEIHDLTFSFEKALDRAKREMADKIIQNIEVMEIETDNLLNPDYRNDRTIYFTLYVVKKK